MMGVVGAGVAGLLVLAAITAAEELLSDPTRAFVEGYDPSGNAFLANVPERTVLLRIRADFDNDGIQDLALSDSSTWGNAGGQWLLFRGQRDHRYLYWGTLFFSPGVAALHPVGRGTSEMALYVRTRTTQEPASQATNGYAPNAAGDVRARLGRPGVTRSGVTRSNECASEGASTASSEQPQQLSKLNLPRVSNAHNPCRCSASP
jgi:hypothetical protein